MGDARIRQQAFMLPAGEGGRFCVLREPSAGRCQGLVLHVPAFAEEMNKSRRMVAWCARELAAAGFPVLQLDLMGCGDSTGDLSEASWSAWSEDVLAGVARLREARDEELPLWLWAHRSGALLAATALQALPPSTALLLWQPVLAGAQHLTQFLRLAAAADALAAGADREIGKRLRAELAEGAVVEVAGYRLPGAVANGLGAATFDLPAGHAGPVGWIEVAMEGAGTIAPASEATIARLRAAGSRIDVRTVQGPRFWQTVEIEDAPAIVDATLDVIIGQAHVLDRSPRFV